MKDACDWADLLVKRLPSYLAKLPEAFFDSFEFTETGNNLTHPLTTGILAKLLWDTPEVASVGLDVRLNRGNGIKLQPDLVAYDAALKPIVMVDYESPNSSDARVIWKDVAAYCSWNAQCSEDVPFVIITTLPDRPVETWQLRWTAKGKWNEEHRGQEKHLRFNPLQYWLEHYRKAFAEQCMDHIALVNLNGRLPMRLFPT